MKHLEAFEEKIGAGETLDEGEYLQLGAYREHIEDMQDIVLGQGLGIEAKGIEAKPPKERSAGASLAIVVGHTSNSAGAYARGPINQSEYFWNKDLAERLKSECANRGVPSRIFYRDGIGIRGAYRQVKAWGAACVLELHFNAFNGSAHGTETLYDKDRNAGSKAWAQKLQDAQLDALGLRDRGLKERDPGYRGYLSVSILDIPSALIEPFFGDNAADALAAHSRKDVLAEELAAAAQLVFRT